MEKNKVMKKNKNYNSGITLIALVVTIIVILILARDIFSITKRKKRNNKPSK